MRTLFSVCLSAAAIAVVSNSVQAQQKPAITIDAVRVGFQRLGPEHIFKSGFWTPVYVDVTAGPRGAPKADIMVETDDSDDVRSRYTAALPPLEPNEQFTLLTYTKPSSTNAEMTVSAVIDDRTVALKTEQPFGGDLGRQLFLAIGNRLPSLRRAFAQMQGPTKSTTDDEGSGLDDRDSQRQLAVTDAVNVLPNRWFAYEPIDVIILTTGNRDFTTALVNEREGRKEALADWVRRGGRLVVTVGRNQDMIAGLGPIQELLPVTMGGVQQVSTLNSLGGFAHVNRPFDPRLNRNNPNQKAVIEVAKLKPKACNEVESILAEQGLQLIVRGAYGMGSVIVVAFDPDQQPFTSYLADLQVKFWNELANRNIAMPREQHDQRQSFQMNGRENADLAGQLQMNLEEFGDVPVISFGWVALFILIYIIIVGPLDYFFLKKVLKRLELTWITFPTVVITISIIAYFTAYALKGNDQRINKVDLLDIDLETQRVYGNTWFTIFSPRIQHYTVGLEPSAGKPQPVIAGVPDSSLNLSWMGRPDTSFTGTGRARSQGLFRRTYDYTPDATAMIGVPIQVWSTKSFESRWEAGFNPAQPPITAELIHPKGKREAISGEITNHLPAQLENATLIYMSGGAPKCFDLGRLLPNTPVRVDNPRNPRDITQWANEAWSDARPRSTQPPQVGISAPSSISSAIKQLMFQQTANPSVRNNALRYLDQSWRLQRKDEVILVGRVPFQAGAAEELDQGPASFSRLWIGALPGSGQPRPGLLGQLTLETFVRVIIPVKDAGAP
jgi:hypothetical protein